jgi:outer membrane protein OmpA-like peptidoglycan-associated protein
MLFVSQRKFVSMSGGLSEQQREDHWISISDMMSGLMMIFLFIAISYMLHVNQQKDEIREIAVTYSRLQTELYQDLYKEFENNLDDWGATIDPQTLSVRFEAPEVLFETGKDIIRPKFKSILDDFFPRYVSIITNVKYKGDIEEIRIEGHTSSEWNWDTTVAEAYILNMELSQDRTRSVLEHVLNLDAVLGHKWWIQERLTANGLSSSKPRRVEGREDSNASRRVEFRVRTNAERRIVRIIEESGS